MNRLITLLTHPIKSLTSSKKERRHALVGPARLWKMKRDFQIQFLRDKGLKPEHFLLEIGCGTLRGGLPLIEYLDRGHYFGVEVRKEALREGQKELKEASLEEKNPTLLLDPDLSVLKLNQPFDYIWSFSVLIHMSDKILDKTLGFVARHLSVEGLFYANVNIGEDEEGNWQGFPVVWRSFDFYRHACAKHGLQVLDIGPLKDHGHHSRVESQDMQRVLKISRQN